MKPIKSDRSFGAYLVLSFLTCGIYGIYFLHKMAKDTNVICAEDGKWTPNVLVFCLLSLCTCGIYGIFWWTGIADRTKRFGRQLNQHIPNEPSSVMGWFIGGLFLAFPAFVGMYKVIENVNEAAKIFNSLPDRIVNE